MGTAMHFEPEKLICAILYTDEKTADAAISRLTDAYGAADLISEPYCFSDISPYYDEEMSGKVFRRLLSFQLCRNPAELAQIKTATNAIEQAGAESGNRRINLDPGFISAG